MVCFQTMRGNASFYKWRAKYGGMDASLISQMKALDRAMVRHWFKDNGEGEPAVEADVCGPEHASGFAELRGCTPLVRESLSRLLEKSRSAIHCPEGKCAHLPGVDAERWPRLRWHDEGSALPWRVGPLG